MPKRKKIKQTSEYDASEILRQAQKAEMPRLSIFEHRKELYQSMVQKEVVRYLCTEVGELRKALADVLEQHYAEGDHGTEQSE